MITDHKRFGGLKLPNKEEELDLFVNYDPIYVFERYLPLADFLLDEYACPNDDIRMTVEETAYSALLMVISNYRRKKAYEKPVPFSTFFEAFVADLMKDHVEHGIVYKISELHVAAK